MAEELKARTKKFALTAIKATARLPKGLIEEILIKQLVRSSTSIGANYKSACKGRSKAEFISKLNIAEEEADESVYWLELMIQSELFKKNNPELTSILEEAKQITAILTASGKTAKSNNKK